MESVRKEKWPANDKEPLKTDLGKPPAALTTHPASPFLRQQKPRAVIHPLRQQEQQQDWTNPNRFSFPLHKACHPPPGDSGLPFPAHLPGKAFTWCLDGRLPRRHPHGASRTWGPSWESRIHSIFGSTSWQPKDSAASSTTAAERGVYRGERWLDLRPNPPDVAAGLSKTWERAANSAIHKDRRVQSRAGSRLSNPEDVIGAVLAAAASPRFSNSPRGYNQRSLTGTPLIVGRQGQGIASHAAASSGERLSPCGSKRSLASPQGTLGRRQLSPSTELAALRFSPSSTLSRSDPSSLPPSMGGSCHSSPGSTLSRLSPSPRPSSFVSHWISAASSSSPASTHRLSPFSTCSSQASSSGRDDNDVSFGSETDDDFFYVSCRQLTRDLADLSVSPAKPAPSVQRSVDSESGSHVVENPSFAALPDGEFVDDDDDYGVCSDDALSDDVFLDNPAAQPLTVSTIGGAPAGISSVEGQRNSKGRETRAAGEVERAQSTEAGNDALSVEFLRRNSMQSRLRRAWQHRRHRAVGHRRDATPHRPRSKDLSSGGVENYRLRGSPLSPNAPAKLHASPLSSDSSSRRDSHPQLPPDDANATEESREAEPCYYYVISPTDDVNMPDVIAVRKSSVELIRWQNSLRRRRRRQAKRHDLGRSRKREPKASATV